MKIAKLPKIQHIFRIFKLDAGFYIARNNGDLELIDFTSLPQSADVPDSFAAWRSTKIDNRIFQSPELKPSSLMGALLHLWLFGAQRLSRFRQCRRHQIVGRTLKMMKYLVTK